MWASVLDNREEELMPLLQNSGVDSSDFTWQAFAELYEEVHSKLQLRLEEQDHELMRSIRTCKVRMYADVLGFDRVFVAKCKHQKGAGEMAIEACLISMRMRADQE